MTPGDVVFGYGGTKPDRPGVFLRYCPDGRLLVIFGTKTDRSAWKPNHVVEADSRYAKILGLSATTWFTPRGIEPVSLDRVQPTGRQCPPGLFLKLEEVIGVIPAPAATNKTPNAPPPVLVHAAPAPAQVPTIAQLEGAGTGESEPIAESKSGP